MARKDVSLRDLAKELNISIPTVSRALKNHPDISTELKTKVLELSRKLNYSTLKPTSKQQNTKQQTKTIGVIVPNMERSFYASIISGIENYAKKDGYFIIIANSRESYTTETECLENLIKLNVDGLIVCLSQETNDYTHFDHARAKDIPVVFFDRVCRTSEYSSVIADNADAAKELVQHLIDNGAKNIAHIAGPENLNITKERIDGYLKCLSQNNISFNNELLVYCNLSVDSTKKAITKLISAKQIPDAIFCVNDTVAFVAMKELKNKGFKIPDDIAITGFNNEFHSMFVEPPLTTIMHPTIELGEESARLIIRQIESEHPHAPRQIVMKTQLIVRESSIKKQTNS